MRGFVQAIIRNSSTAAILLLVLAVLNSHYVAEGLWQGSGLHGYVIQPGRAHMGVQISVWIAFLQSLALASLASIFLFIHLWQKRWKAKTVEH